MEYDIDLLKKETIKSFVNGASIGSIQKNMVNMELYV